VRFKILTALSLKVYEMFSRVVCYGDTLIMEAVGTACTTCFNSHNCPVSIDRYFVIVIINGKYSLNSVNQLIFVMVKCYVFFAVRTYLLTIT
jgi:hypothetical protein